MLLGEIAKTTFQNPIGKWTCIATDENSSDLSKLTSARSLGKSAIANEPTMQYELKFGEITQIVDISVRSRLPLKTVVNTQVEGMGQVKMIEEYYDFDAAIKIDMPKCG